MSRTALRELYTRVYTLNPSESVTMKSYEGELPFRMYSRLRRREKIMVAKLIISRQ